MKQYDIISFHPGRQHNFEQAAQISKYFKNYKHLTSLYFSSKTVSRWSRISPKVGNYLNKRSFDLSNNVVDTCALPEINLLLKRKVFDKKKSSDFIDRNHDFQKWVVKNYAPPGICIGYDTSSWEVFKEWKKKSFLILDLSIALPQYKKILAKESDFDNDFIINQTKGDDALYDICEDEAQTADLILCGSEFVKKSCTSIGINPEKLYVLPYGADVGQFCNSNLERRDGIIKIVFIGSVNHRKGADILLRAWEQIHKIFLNVELHFYGDVSIDRPTHPERVYFHGFIDRKSLIAELKSASISVLPTFFEGSSLAIYQSMAMGLAVITTPNSGSVIRNNYSGLLINYGSVEELVNSLTLLLNDKKLRTFLSTNALNDIQNYTWDNYGEKLSGVLRTVLKQ